MKGAIVICIQLFLGIFGFGNDLAVHQKGATVNGIIQNGKKGDTLYLTVYPGTYSNNITFDCDLHTAGISFFTAITKDEGRFHFELPRFLIHQIKITLNLREGSDEQVILPMTPFSNQDSLMVRALRAKPIFQIEVSGRGAAKYNAKSRITRSFYHFRDSINLLQQSRISVFLPEEMNEIFDHCIFSAMRQLNSFKNSIDRTNFKILELDLLGDAHNWWLAKLMDLNKKYSQAQQLASLAIFKRAVRADTLVIPEMADLSINYLFLLYNIISDQLRLQYPLFDSTSIQFKLNKIYEQFVTHFRGHLRENMIFQLLRYNPDMYLPIYDSTTIPFWGKAFHLFTDPILKEYAWKRMHFTLKGAEPYPFALPDSNGRIVKLEHFKGKAILIDVWFTGCRGCLLYAKWLKNEVYPVFDKDTNIVFISISGDINRNTWISSMRSGRYIDQGKISLYTGGLGFSDPFMKYYDFDGGPYTLLIDKNGKLFSANLPLYDSSLFIQLLKQAVQQ